ncbi:uncharacterized protein LOC133448690 [Cololabis saira]|uniref:uncharacterized protein LOC133448690 n=1 Tax=Cololabis saira TaxID=129043 RepID=UPI002AD259BE|nr:uncharacterized protein LOC133448690 [Cololabis saira]
MMDFWSENQGQSHLDSRCGTVRRTFAHNYRDRHDAALYPLYYEEQQDQGREPSYWTAVGSRTGRAMPEYANWTDPELTSSSHFPFILDRQTQHHQDLGEYQQQHEARAREWTTSHRPPRDYERGNLNEMWQRRFEPNSPIRYNRESYPKRSGSSYRELEAWAARYSHSLPRRKRIEAELRGTPRGQVEGCKTLERDSRSGTDPQGAALQHVQQIPNSRVSEVLERGDRQQAPSYLPHPSQFPTPDIGHMVDVKENIGLQRRMYSQPPGYIAPPPYNSPHKSSPSVHQWDTNWEQGGKGHAYWSQPMLRKQDATGEGGEFANPDESITCIETGLMHQRQEASVSTAAGPIGECMLALQDPQVDQNSKINQETSKVIEGRKFRLNKKSGGMTIFCLVSRIADTTESPSLPLCNSQTNIQNREVDHISEEPGDSGDLSQMCKLSDEVDIGAPTIRAQSDTHDVRSLTATQTDLITCEGQKKFEDKSPNKAENISTEKPSRNSDSSTSGRQIGDSEHPVLVKYPLWREPSSTSRTETESSTTCSLKANGEEEESDGALNQHGDPHISKETNNERKPLDIKDSEDRKALLVIDTTCVVVKVEMIPSPQKEHVHYLDSTGNAETSQFHDQTIISSELTGQLNQDVTTDHNTDATFLQRKEGHEPRLDSTFLENEEHTGEMEVSLSCVVPPPLFVKETSEERAKRILGIPLHDDIIEQEPTDETTCHESNIEKQGEEPELPLTEQTVEDMMDEGESLNPLQVVQAGEVACLKDSNDMTPVNEDTEGLAEPQDYVEHIPEENQIVSQLRTDNETTAQTEATEVHQLESAIEKCKSEQQQYEIQPIYNESSQLPDPFPSSLPPPDLTFPLTISDSSTQESPDPELLDLTVVTNLSPCPDTNYLHQLPSPLPSGSTVSPSNSSPHTDHLPSHPPPPLDLTDPTADTGSIPEDKEDEASLPNENELSCEFFATDMSEEVVSKHAAECQQSDSTACDTAEQHNPQTEIGLGQRLDTSEDKHIDVTILAQHGQKEGVAFVKECDLIEEQPPEESKEDLTHLSGQTPKMDEEHISDGHAEDNISQRQFNFGQDENVFCEKESGMSEDQSQETPAELVGDLGEQTLGKNRNDDAKTQIETSFFKDPEAPPESCNSSPPPVSCTEMSLLDELSLSEIPSPPHTPLQQDTEIVPLLDVGLICPSSLTPDGAVAGFLEIVPPPLHLDSCEESIQLSYAPLSNSPPPPRLHAGLAYVAEPVQPPSLTPPTHAEAAAPGFLPSAVHKKEPQCPKSLWDVVNRIRKHTAPDSENEEEEVNELWDPENVGENLSCPAVLDDVNINGDEAEQQVVLEETDEGRHFQQDQKELVEHSDEDALSCSSSTSHGSEDTIIVADESTDDAKTGEESQEYDIADGEMFCSGEVKDEATDEEGKAEDEADTNKPGQSEQCPGEVENVDQVKG